MLGRGPFSGASGSAVGGGILVTSVGDERSLVPTSLHAKQWHTIDVPHDVPCPPQVLTYTDPNGQSFADGHVLNPYKTATAGAVLVEAFATPVGCTAVNVVLEAMLRTPDTTETLVISVYLVDGTTLVNSRTCVLTGSMQAFTLAVTGLTGGTEYRVKIHCNDIPAGTTSQARALISGRGLRVEPVDATTAPYAGGNFTRIPVTSRILHNNLISQIISRRPNHSPSSSVIVVTDQLSMGLEYLRNYTVSDVDPLILVDGRPYAIVSLSGSNAVLHATVTLPAGLKTVEIVIGAQNNSATMISPTVNGMWLRAVYLPYSSANYVVQPTVRERRMVIYGDSIVAGFGTLNTQLCGAPSILRRDFPGSIVVEAWGSRSLAEDCSDRAAAGAAVSSAANIDAFVAKVAAANPTDFVSCIGTNDYAGSYMTAVNFGLTYTALKNALRAALPNCRLWFVTPVKRAVETQNSLGAGNTMADYRANVPATAAPWVTQIDGTIAPFPTATTTGIAADYFDTVHLNENGLNKMAAGIRAGMTARVMATSDAAW